MAICLVSVLKVHSKCSETTTKIPVGNKSVCYLFSSCHLFSLTFIILYTVILIIIRLVIIS